MLQNETEKAPLSHLSDSAAYESWAITYRRPSESLRNWSSFLGYKFRKTVEVDPGKIIAVVPKTRFAQSDLEDVVVRTKTLHRWNSRVGYEEDLERRLHKLDYRVQDELYAIMERQEADEEKNYKLEVLVEVPSDPTDSGLRMLCRRWWQRVLRKNGEKLTPHVEYRIVLRESKAEDRSSVRVKEGYQVLID